MPGKMGIMGNECGFAASLRANHGQERSGMHPAASTVANCGGKRSAKDAAGANGINTGNSVCSLTNRASWGFQNRAVAYQLPSAVV